MNRQDRYTSIPVFRRTQQELKALKRGGESWDSLIRRMHEQYDPTEHVN